MPRGQGKGQGFPAAGPGKKGRREGTIRIFPSALIIQYSKREERLQAAPLPKGSFLNILELLSCESSELFLRYFKDSLNELVQNQFVAPDGKGGGAVPQDFLVNHISGSFVEMVLWWIKGGMKQTPEELDRYFRAVIEPIL